jgi:GNAT superfamily N-acetyltransferase
VLAIEGEAFPAETPGLTAPGILAARMAPAFLLRTASVADIPAIVEVMAAAIRELQKPFLSADAIAGSLEIMGLDTQLIADATYFVAEGDGGVVGCGGWSNRATLFGGDHAPGRNSSLLDPKSDAARIRAMYTRPSYARRGVGRAILRACEAAAAAAGFARIELVATLSGEPLYRACGYTVIEALSSRTTSGVEIPLVRMGQRLRAERAGAF